MKTFEEVQKEIEEKGFGRAYTLSKFRSNVRCRMFISDDGIGFLHDGEKETDISVWSISLNSKKYNKYPYVIWYNK